MIRAGEAANSGSAVREAGLVQMLIELRAQARASRDFARADAIRNQLAALGVTLEDGPKGTGFRVS